MGKKEAGSFLFGKAKREDSKHKQEMLQKTTCLHLGKKYEPSARFALRVKNNRRRPIGVINYDAASQITVNRLRKLRRIGVINYDAGVANYGESAS